MKFTTQKYDEMKAKFKELGYDTKLLAQYAVMTKLRYRRHRKEIEATDEQLEAVVNKELDVEILEVQVEEENKN